MYESKLRAAGTDQEGRKQIAHLDVAAKLNLANVLLDFCFIL